MATRQFIPCLTCGGLFKQPQDNRKYCCRTCYEQARAIKPLVCAHCGKTYVKKANQKNSKYCDEACQIASRRVKPHICITCGTVFSPVKYKRSESRFVGATGRKNCSKECLDIWKSKSKSEYMRANRERFSGANSWNWKGSCLRKNKSYRGAEWPVLADKIRHRDGRKCVHCGMTEEEHQRKWSQTLEVHHKIPFHEFTDYKKANRPGNLITLCKSCHMTADRIIKHRQLMLIFEDEPRKKSRDGLHRGESNARSLLKEVDVVEIKRRLRLGERQSMIADAYGVKKTIISAISTGQNWGYVPWPSVQQLREKHAEAFAKAGL